MHIYAGIDEAGYGPLFGPLLVARAVFQLPDHDHPADGHKPPALWKLLRHAVCKNLSKRKSRIAVNDSKKLHSAAVGIAHLERGVLAFAGLSNRHPTHVGDLLDHLGERTHHQLGELPWYAPCQESPWQNLPCACTAGEIAVARAMLVTAATRANILVPDLGARVVFENQFNRMVAATHSKAATSFTFVAAHLQHIWQQFGRHHPTVIVDRQSGRTHYRELLAINFPAAQIRVLDESDNGSAYHLREGERQMTIRFEVDADANHMPVALASMVAKYVRELLMARFNAYFTARAPDLKPTAGYATDGRRFWNDLQPHLDKFAIDAADLRRIS